MTDSKLNTGLDIVTIQCGTQVVDMFVRTDSSDRFVLGQIFRDNSYDISTLKRFSDLEKLYARILNVGKLPCVIDAGANIGASSVYFALMMRSSLIIAIEPDADNYCILSENVRGLNVSAVKAALTSDSHDSKVLDVGNGEWGFVTIPIEKHNDSSLANQVVRGTTIPKIFSDTPNIIPFIVKIDIEGAEAEVFSQNTTWIKSVPLIIIEPHDWLFPRGGGMVNFFREVSSLDFDIEVRGENIFVINNDARVWDV